MVCFDMQEMSSQRRLVTQLFKSKKKQDDDSCVTYVKFWLDAIQLHAHGAPVVLVGTHRDEVSDAKAHQSISEQLKELFGSHGCWPHIVNGPDGLCFFPVDNKNGLKSGTAAGLIQLQQALEQTAMQQDYVNRLVPGTWLAMLDTARMGHASSSQGM